MRKKKGVWLVKKKRKDNKRRKRGSARGISGYEQWMISVSNKENEKLKKRLLRKRPKTIKLNYLEYTVAVYGDSGMNRNEIAKKLNMEPGEISGVIYELDKKNVINRLGIGVFRIKENVFIKKIKLWMTGHKK